MLEVEPDASGVAVPPAASAPATIGVDSNEPRQIIGLLRVGGSGSRTDVRFKPRMLGPHAEQKFVVQGLPGIGDVVSDALLGTSARCAGSSRRPRRSCSARRAWEKAGRAISWSCWIGPSR